MSEPVEEVLLKDERPTFAARDPGLLFALFLAVACLCVSWDYGRSFPGEDFYLHHSLARAALAPETPDLWTEPGRRRAGELMAARAQATPAASAEIRRMAAANRVPLAVASPFLVAAFSACTTADYATDWLRYQVVCLVCTALAIAVFGHAAGLGLCGVLLAFCACSVFFEPYRSALRTGNVSQLQLGGLALFALVQVVPRATVRSLSGGAVLGALVAFKPNLLLAVVLLVLSRIAARAWARLEWELTGMAGAALAAAGWASMRLGGWTVWSSWPRALSEFLAAPPALASGNHALSLVLPGYGQVLGVAAIAVSVVFVWRRSARGMDHSAAASPARPALDDLRTLGIGIAAMLLTAPVAWLHYDNLQLPLLLLTMRPAPPAPGRTPQLARQVLALAAMLCGSLYPMLCVVAVSNPWVFAALSRAGTGMLLLAALLDRGGGAGLVPPDHSAPTGAPAPS